MPSGGAIQVGFRINSSTQPSRVQFIGNPDGEDTLILENRYAGPVALQWADSDIQVGSGLIGQPMSPNMNIPPLSRITIPWPREYGANVQVMTGQFGNTLIDNAMVAANFFQYRVADLRYWWTDAHASQFHAEPLYPSETQRVILARSGTGLIQGNKQMDIVVGGGNITTIAGSVAATLVKGIGDDQVSGQTPVNIIPEARIMKVAVRMTGGTALLADLECTPFYDVNANGNSFYPYGSTGASTSEHNLAGPFDCPGAVGCVWDIDGAAAAATATFVRMYWVTVPFD